MKVTRKEIQHSTLALIGDIETEANFNFDKDTWFNVQLPRKLERYKNSGSTVSGDAKHITFYSKNYQVTYSWENE